MQAKVVFPHPFPKTFYMGAVFNGVFFAFLQKGAEGTGRAPTNKRTPDAEVRWLVYGVLPRNCHECDRVLARFTSGIMTYGR